MMADTVPSHHQEQCPWCGEFADWNGPEVGMVVLDGLWRPVHLGSQCERLVNAWLAWGTQKPPYYEPTANVAPEPSDSRALRPKSPT